MKIDPKKTTTFGLETWVRNPRKKDLPVLPPSPVVHVDRIRGMLEYLGSRSRSGTARPPIFMPMNSHRYWRKRKLSPRSAADDQTTVPAPRPRATGGPAARERATAVRAVIRKLGPG